MTQPAKVQEPSMEEILASIRRIIADDEAKPEEAVVAGAALSMPALESPPPRHESPPARIHNISPHPIAAVAQPPVQKPVAAPPVAVPPIQSRGDSQPMVASVDKSATSSSQIFGKPASVETPSMDDADVFDLTDDMALPGSMSSFRTVEPTNDVEFAEPPPPMTERREPPRPVAAALPPRSSAPPSMEDILSQQTASAVESAFNSLASTVLSANSRTLEDLVKEMMRPMLKNWLDDNLPGLVERIVKTEIERVARGR